MDAATIIETAVGGGQDPTPSRSGYLPDGKPFRRYVKDILKVGSYRHPVDGWRWQVTPEKLRELADKYQSMADAGLDVEITRDHSPKADDILGYVVGMFVMNDQLFAEMEFRGEESIGLATRVRNVSIEVDPDLKDGEGKKWGEAITAVSLVKAPVYSGQGEFIAASRGRVPVLKFSTKGTNEMDLLKVISEALGIDDLSEDNAEEKIKDLGRSRKTADEKLAALETKVAELTAALEEARKSKGDGKPKGLSREMQEVLDERRETLAESLSDLEGKTLVLSKESITEIRDLILGGSGEGRNVAMLSRAADGPAPAKRFVDLIRKNATDPVRPGTKTFSRGSTEGGDEEQTPEAQKALIEEMVSLA